ncbi:MAG: MTH1187 family thiamine-binding protein [Candidatus Dadabacteria bacterium]|nr:MTH1187 family thiamine-binding protein [Candidatus Dadabacteria bacterium]
MALAEVSVIPIGTPTSSIGDWIAEAVKVLEKEGAKYEISPMGTLIEGEASDIFTFVRKMHEAALKRGMRRVVTMLIIDDRRDKEVTMKSKVAAVKKRLKASSK